MKKDQKCKNYDLFIELSKDKDTNEIRNQIFEKYQYIVEIVTKKYCNKGIDYEDIYQIASIGLLYAIDRFDPDKGFEFTSFATPTILGEVKKHFRDKGWTIKVPRRIQELSGKISTARQELCQKIGIVPSIGDIAEYLECSAEDVIEAMEASEKAYSPKSLDLTYNGKGDSKEMRFSDLVGEEDKHFVSVENIDFIEGVIKKLNELEVRILKERYINDSKTQTELSEEIGISQVTISRMEKKIFEKFRKEYEKCI